MAELLSALAAASQLAEQVLKIAVFISEIRDAPESIRKQSVQLQQLIGIARLIENNPSLQTSEVRSVLLSCIGEAKELQEILAEISTAAGDGKVREVWKAVVGRSKEKEILNHLSSIERGKSSLELCIGEINSTLLQMIHDKVPEISQRVEAIHDGMQQLTATSPSTEEEWQSSSQAALFLTEPRDVRERLIITKGKRVQGTCEWITTHETYVSWLASPSQLLWLSGGPGKGKTMLSIFLTQELDKLAMLSQNAISTYFFCDNGDNRRKSAVAILRGLILQLIGKQPKLFKHIIPDFKVQRGALLSDSSFESLWRIFESMVRDASLDSVFCVLDGLDECDEGSVEMLTEKLKDFFSNQPKGCLKVIVVSRELPDCLPRALSGFPHVKLDPDSDQEVNKDLQQFIIIKVGELATKKSYPASLRTSVEKALVERAGGTFLWVSFVVEELRKKARTEVQDCLEHLPTGLDGMYARMLLQIREARRAIAASILRWVAMAMRPLTLVELGEATGIEPSANLTFDEVMKDHIGYCGYLLAVTGDKVGMVHQSAKEYLLRKDPDHNPHLELFRVNEEETHSEMARKCLKCLQSDAFANAPVEPRWFGPVVETTCLQDVPLLSYAVFYWPIHARYSSSSAEDIFDLPAPFYVKKSRIRELWWRTYSDPLEFGIPELLWGTYLESAKSGIRGLGLRHGTEPLSPLHFASFFGIVPLAQKLLQRSRRRTFKLRGGHVDKTNGLNQTPLFYASLNGHKAVGELLLSYHADVNAKDIDGESALHSAAAYGHETVIQLLLEHNAIVDAKDSSGETALHKAAFSGHERVVQLLLEHNAIVDAKDSSGETALCIAAASGHERVVQLLLEHNAIVDAKDSSGETVLHKAAFSGHERVVQLLLEHNADVNTKDEEGKTPLHQSTLFLYENTRIPQLLLEHKADVDAKDKGGWTTLHINAFRGNQKMVQLLLDHNADINAREDEGWTPLDLATLEDHEEVVQLLLDHKADINAQNGRKRTALHNAALLGRGKMIRFLLEHNADINAKDDEGKTPLDLATIMGYEEVVQLLQAHQPQSHPPHSNMLFLPSTATRRNFPPRVAASWIQNRD